MRELARTRTLVYRVPSLTADRTFESLVRKAIFLLVVVVVASCPKDLTSASGRKLMQVRRFHALP